MNPKLEKILRTAEKGHGLETKDIRFLLDLEEKEQVETLFATARGLRSRFFGNKIFPFDAPNDKDGTDESSSSLFSGLINSGNQGQIIPLIYGEVYTGSVVISQGVKAQEAI